MSLTVKLNDVDVTNSLNFNEIILYDRLGGMFDNISVCMPLADKIELEKGYKITIESDDFSTGSMYIDSVYETDSVLMINAISCNQTNKKQKSKIWRNVKLSEIISDIAKNYGISFKTYGIEDFTYESITQLNETDLQLLDRICLREGYSIKIDDDCLIVFSEYVIEHLENVTTLDYANDSFRKSYSFQDSNDCVHSYTVSCYNDKQGLITATSIDTDNESVGTSKRKNEYVTSLKEAQRFSKGYLRNSNKNKIIGNLSMNFNPKISAGTLVDLTGFEERNGRYIVTEIMHDVLNELTKFKIRKVLSY